MSRAACRLPLLALAALCAPPLAAQEAPEAAPPAAEAAPDAPSDAAPGLPAAGPIVLLDAPEPLVADFGDDPLDDRASLCLAEGETAILASDRVTFTLEGEGCFLAAEAEERAWRAERRETDPEFARQEAMAAREREESARVAAPMRSAPRVRAGAVRGSTPVPPRPVIFRVYSGSPAVLARLPRGAQVQRETAVCLKDGEQVTINVSTGQSVTYRGPGCLNRKARPTRNNIGGFTFG